jgi:hypothetical protein
MCGTLLEREKEEMGPNSSPPGKRREDRREDNLGNAPGGIDRAPEQVIGALEQRRRQRTGILKEEDATRRGRTIALRNALRRGTVRGAPLLIYRECRALLRINGHARCNPSLTGYSAVAEGTLSCRPA